MQLEEPDVLVVSGESIFDLFHHLENVLIHVKALGLSDLSV